MIRINDKPEKLMQELLEDHKKAIYWFLKGNGGAQKLEVIRRQLWRHSEKVNEGCHTFATEYKSWNGNTWAVYIGVEYIPSMGRRFFQDIALSFYMEENDIYLFCPMVIPGEEPVGLIYTPRFFQTYREVKGLTQQKGALLGMFTRDLRLSPYHLDADNHVEIHLHSGTAKGTVRSSSPMVLELNEYVSSPSETGIDADACDRRLFDNHRL